MIEHLKSGLSISTHFGCEMACSYCILSSLNGFNNGPKQVMTPKEIISQLFEEKSLFINGQTPLIINNRTDPMHPMVFRSTINLLEMLVSHGVVSPVLIISKFAPIDDLRQFVDELPLMYIYSYSCLPSDFNYSHLEKALNKITKVMPEKNRFHYLRPIIPNVNDDLDKIINCLSAFKEHNFSGSIVTGLRVTESNRHLVSDNIEYNPHHKIMNQGLYDSILKFARKMNFSYSIFRHTSCAISAFTNSRCKLNYYGKEGHCNPNCSNKACSKLSKIDKELIFKDISSRFDSKFDVKFVDDNKLLIEKDITQEQLAFIKNAFGVSINAERIVLSQSERSILGYE